MWVGVEMSLNYHWKVLHSATKSYHYYQCGTDGETIVLTLKSRIHYLLRKKIFFSWDGSQSELLGPLHHEYAEASGILARCDPICVRPDPTMISDQM